MNKPKAVTVDIISYSKLQGVKWLARTSEIPDKKALMKHVSPQDQHDADVIFSFNIETGERVMLKDVLSVPKMTGLVTFGFENRVVSAASMEFRVPHGEASYKHLFEQVVEKHYEEASSSLWVTVTIDDSIWVLKSRGAKFPYILASASSL